MFFPFAPGGRPRRGRPILFVLAVLLVFSFTARPAPAESGAVLPDKETVRRIVAPLFTDGAVRSLVVGAVNASGRVVYGFGDPTGKGAPPPDARSIYEIGSITKTFTGLLLALAQFEGKIDLTNPIRGYLPQGVIPKSSPLAGVAFLDLAAHASGLPERPYNLPGNDPLNPFKGYTRGLLYDFLKSAKPQTPVGSTYAYSNVGAGLAGVLLERIYGRDFETLVREKICVPLGMDDTRITLEAAMRPRFLPGHGTDLARVPNWDTGVLKAAGAFRSTAGDLLTYAAANLGLVPTPLYPAMLTAHVPRFHVGRIPEQFVGLFWNVYNIKKRRYLVHAGRSGGFFAVLLLDPGRRTAVVLTANNEGDLSQTAWKILQTAVEPPKAP